MAPSPSTTALSAARTTAKAIPSCASPRPTAPKTSDNKDLPDINQLLADGKSTGTLTSFAFTVCDVK